VNIGKSIIQQGSISGLWIFLIPFWTLQVVLPGNNSCASRLHLQKMDKHDAKIQNFHIWTLDILKKTMIILMGYHMISYVSLHEQDEVSPGKPYKPAVQVYPPCLIPLCSGTPNSSWFNSSLSKVESLSGLPKKHIWRVPKMGVINPSYHPCLII